MYVGEFYRDQKHGSGMMYLVSGEVYSEQWVQGKRITSVNVTKKMMTEKQNNSSTNNTTMKDKVDRRGNRIATKKQHNILPL